MSRQQIRFCGADSKSLLTAPVFSMEMLGCLCLDTLEEIYV